MRLYIGGISSELSKTITDLEERLSKYGTITKSIELYAKPIGETSFGFVSMDISEEQFASLKKRYNNVTFKGSVLTVSPAKSDFIERWRLDKERPDPLPNKDQRKRMYSLPVQEDGVILGRERESKRDWRRATIRFNKKGTTKSVVLKCKKTKLWGYQKDKNLNSLVYEYIRGKWLDGSGDTVEVIRQEQANEEEDIKGDEKARNMRLLEEIFGGDEDWEIKNIKENEDVMSWEDEDSNAQQNLIQWNSDDEEGNDSKAEAQDEDYEDSGEVQVGDEEEDDSKAESQDVDYEDSGKVEEDDEESYNGDEPSNESLLQDENGMDDVQPVRQLPKNTTESLRQLFDTQDESFSLFPNLDSDIHDEPEPLNEPETFIQPIRTQIPRSHVGLFFPHYESPFLNSQSQISKLKTIPVDGEKWKAEFYEKRGEWNREFKRRRRDVLRQLRKKNLAKSKLY
jgi:nucleolar protein 8